MKNLADTIEKYYKDNFDKMPAGKKFHFSSRLYSWKNDEFSKKYLATVKNDYVHLGDKTKILSDIEELLVQPPTPPELLNAFKVRKPYFDKYPLLTNLNKALFRTHYLRSIYNYDARDLLLKTTSKKDIDELVAQVASDRDAVRVLSTYVVNAVFLAKRILWEDEDFINNFCANEYANATQYPLRTPVDIQLQIYLYTHLIIGDSKFYTASVSPARRELFVQMLQDLEKIIDTNFSNVNLDNKYEFLVCCRIMDYNTALAERIHGEAIDSFSADGDFIVDVHNNMKQLARSDFSTSEHRNILLIMSSGDYPHHGERS